MAEIISMLLLADPPFLSEGEIALGRRLDQVIEVTAFPADVEIAALLEIRLDPQSDGDGISLDLSLESEEFAVPLVSQFIPNPARGEEWPFPPDVPVIFPGTIVSVPAEAEAYLTARIDGEIRETKWLRVVEFEVVVP